jgi:hypothetical protein
MNLDKETIFDHIMDCAKVLQEQTATPMFGIIDKFTIYYSDTPEAILERTAHRIEELKALGWNEKTIRKRVKKENRRLYGPSSI